MSAFLRRHRQKILPALLAAAALILAIVFRGPLVAWFTGKPDSAPDNRAAGHDAHRTPPPPAARPRQDGGQEQLPPHEFAPAVLASLETAYAAYEDIRARLAGDSLDGVPAAARRLEQALRAAAQNVKDAPEVRGALESGASAAHELSERKALDTARLAFGKVSRALVELAGADRRLAGGRHVFECPMTKDYNRWIQSSDKLENPYMGRKMLACGSAAEFPGPEAHAGDHAGDHAGHVPGGDEVAYYTCSMHPSVKQDGPGKCPICGMDLTPVSKQEVETGVIIVDAARRQLIGVKTAVIERRKLQKAIRTVGRITYDTTRIHDVTVKFKGFIGQLFADAPGKRVKRGHALFTVYSPEVYQAQQDLLIARDNTELAKAARRRLELLDVPLGSVRSMIEKGEPARYVPIVSPASGYLVEKNVFAGSAVEPGMPLMRIANLDKVWIEAELYEAELPLVEVGQTAGVTLPYLPDKRFTGQIKFVYPYLSGATRTGQVRIELDNDNVELKPDMYANVEIAIDRGERLTVPESAVIYAGPRRIVFLDLGEGRLRPQEIEVGIKTGDWYEVRSGLRAGQKVVTSGNFLIAAESRLKSATGQW